MCGRKKIILFEHMGPLLPGGSVLFVVKFRLRELRWFSSVWDIIVVQAAKAVVSSLVRGVCCCSEYI